MWHTDVQVQEGCDSTYGIILYYSHFQETTLRFVTKWDLNPRSKDNSLSHLSRMWQVIVATHHWDKTQTQADKEEPNSPFWLNKQSTNKMYIEKRITSYSSEKSLFESADFFS